MADKDVVRWVCVYDPWDGSELKVSTSDECLFEDLPSDGIQGLIKLFADGTRSMVTGFDWYFAVEHPNGDVIISGNNDGLEENMRRYPGIVLKRGKHTTDEWAHLISDILGEENLEEPCPDCPQ